MQKRMLVAAAVLALLLGGCTGSPAIPEHTATPTPTPAFASDADALAAAEAAYAKYQTMEDTISHEGGKDPDRIRPFASRDALEGALSSFAGFQKEGLHSTGQSSFSHSLFVGQNHSRTGVAAVTIRACLDVSMIDVVDSQGVSTISDNRQPRQTFDLVFDLRERSLTLASRAKSVEQSQC